MPFRSASLAPFLVASLPVAVCLWTGCASRTPKSPAAVAAAAADTRDSVFVDACHIAIDSVVLHREFSSLSIFDIGQARPTLTLPSTKQSGNTAFYSEMAGMVTFRLDGKPRRKFGFNDRGHYEDFYTALLFEVIPKSLYHPGAAYAVVRGPAGLLCEETGAGK